MRSFESLCFRLRNGLRVQEQGTPRIVLLPGWWFEILGGTSALLCLGFLLAFGSQLPHVLPLVLFTVMMIAAENTSIVLPTEASVSPAFMIVMAAIAAFGHHGAVVGASIVGLSGVFNLDTIKRHRYTAAFNNGGQYLLASAAAAAAYGGLGV